MNARGLTRVRLPVHIDHAWPCDIAEAEQSHRQRVQV